MLAEQIRNKELLEESINEIKKENPAANLQLLEKTIGTLYLVENLANNGLDFIFKGGTSLVLLLNDLKRFSVDVDIITEESSEKVLQCVKSIVQNNDLFTRYEENIRENSASQRMELQHFKFFFKSATDGSEKYILLDVAYEVLTAASKVLYLINLIKSEKYTIEKYGENSVISEIDITSEYKKRLNKIKKYNKEAYYYIFSILFRKAVYNFICNLIKINHMFFIFFS